MFDFLRLLGAQLRAVWDSWSTPTRIMMVGVIAILIGAIAFASVFATRPSMDVLFSDLTPERANDIASYLREENIPFELTNNGTTIRVPSRQALGLRLQIASGASGIRFRSGEVGFEVFPSPSFGTTERLMDINYQRALTGQLQRTIQASPLVSACQVLLTIPKETLFREQQKPPQASVMLKLRGSVGVEEVNTIQHLVASAVEGLKPEAVVVTDTELRTLSSPVQPDWVSRLTSTQLGVLETKQSSLREAALQVLSPIVGPGNASVQVALEMDFNEVSERSEKFGTPVVEHEEDRKKEMTKTVEGGIPGVGSNTVDGSEVAGTGGNVISSETSRELSTDNAIPKTVREVREAPGKVLRMTVSALLKEREEGPRDADEVKKIESLLRQAVGLNEERGDLITVEQFKFAPVEVAAAAPTDWTQLLGTLLPVAGLVVLVVLAAVMLFVSMRRPVVAKAPVPVTAAVSEPKRIAEMSPEELGIVSVDSVGSLSPEDQRRIKLREQILRFAEQKPAEVAQIIKTWLVE